MAPKGSKRKLEPTDWAELDVTGLIVQWKVTAAGMVHFKWEGSSKQTLTLTKDEGVQDAPRRVRARVEHEPAAKEAAKTAGEASRLQSHEQQVREQAARAWAAREKEAREHAERVHAAPEQAPSSREAYQEQVAPEVSAPTARRHDEIQQRVSACRWIVLAQVLHRCYFVDGDAYWKDTCAACGIESPSLKACSDYQRLFCDVPCERRGGCPHVLYDDDDANDEAARDVGCMCACCQQRDPGPCHDCNSGPCFCAIIAGPGKRWINPRRVPLKAECVFPTPQGGEELWSVRYAPWCKRRGEDPLDLSNLPGSVRDKLEAMRAEALVTGEWWCQKHG